MAEYHQQQFEWAGNSSAVERPTNPLDAPPPATESTSDPLLPTLPVADSVPLALPLRAAIEQGIFGVTTEGPIEPDEDEVRAITSEQATELTALLADLQSVEDALRTGEDPRTGKVPRTPEAQQRLRTYLEQESPRLSRAYSDALSAYTDAFGEEAATRLDLWVRKMVADCTIPPSHRYDPGHPWHYYHQGDNAPPIPVEDIEADADGGRFIERDLPKNRAKRTQRIREMLETERIRVAEDKQRYQEIVKRGAEALSRYDREIAHSSDEMARATALSLKYNHIRWGLSRLAWLEAQANGLGILVQSPPAESDRKASKP